MRTERWLSALALTGALATTGAAAQAQNIIRSPGQHRSHFEIEVHGAIAYGWRGNNDYFIIAPGVRFGIPLMNNGFVRSINNMPAINFGIDTYFYPGRREFYMGISLPVVLQWNFYLHTRWSIFAEAGFAPEIYPYYDAAVCRDSGWGCSFWIWPATAFGFRFHFRQPADFPALTVRVGFPTGLNVGVSF